VPLVGREEDLTTLGAWLGEPRPVAVRCVIGQGGSGKTRVAIELCERAATAGWHAGFVTYDELTRFAALQNLAAWRWPGRTLLMIDYAATGAVVVRRWLEQLTRLLDPSKVSADRRLRLCATGEGANTTVRGSCSLSRPKDGRERFPLPDPLGQPVALVELPGHVAELEHGDVAGRDDAEHALALDNGKVAEGALVHATDGGRQRLLGVDGLRVGGHDLADLGLGGVLPLGDDADEEVALGEDADHALVLHDEDAAATVLGHALGGGADGLVGPDADEIGAESAAAKDRADAALWHGVIVPLMPMTCPG
jgi:hypothetical protein